MSKAKMNKLAASLLEAAQASVRLPTEKSPTHRLIQKWEKEGSPLPWMADGNSAGVVSPIAYQVLASLGGVVHGTMHWDEKTVKVYNKNGGNSNSGTDYPSLEAALAKHPKLFVDGVLYADEETVATAKARYAELRKVINDGTKAIQQANVAGVSDTQAIVDAANELWNSEGPFQVTDLVRPLGLTSIAGKALTSVVAALEQDGFQYREIRGGNRGYMGVKVWFKR